MRATAIDWPRTLVARGAQTLSPAHLRQRAAQPERGRLHVFVLDVSGSMRTEGRLALAKGLLLALLEDAYRRREHVALLCFSAGGVELRLPPGRAGRWNEALLAPIGGGGGTRLAPALQRAAHLLQRSRRSAPQRERCLWLLTDGRFNERPPRPEPADQLRVVDLEQGQLRLGRAALLAQAWGAECWPVDAWGTTP